MRAYRRGALVCGLLAVLGIGVLMLRDGDPAATAASGATGWADAKPKPKAKIVSNEEREDLLARAQLWSVPPVPIEQFDFTDRHVPREVSCRFMVTELNGTTPKFDCSLVNGDPVRIKYGRTGELPAEVATTRLLRALGFGADHVSLVQRLRCYGCPPEPFSVMKAVEITQAETLYRNLMVGYDKYEDFEWVTLERRFGARAIETDRISGWGLFELDKVAPSKGGAARREIDALRLLAVFLAHWDSKSDNQRLVCLSQWEWNEGERCRRPFLLLQDVGATFGPYKVDLKAWRKAPIWEDRRACTTSMRTLPFDGATFGAATITEEGRQFLATQLGKLSDRQLTDLFTYARFDQPLGLLGRTGPIADWVTVFKERVRQIADGPPCPSST